MSRQEGFPRVGLQLTVGVVTPEADLGDARQSLLLPLDGPAALLSASEMESLAGLRPFAGFTQAEGLMLGLRAKVAPVDPRVPLNLGRPAEAEAGSGPSRQQRRAAVRMREQAHLRLTVAVLAQVIEDEGDVVATIELTELEGKLTAEERAAIRNLQPLTVVAGGGEALLLITLAYEPAPDRALVALPLHLRPVS